LLKQVETGIEQIGVSTIDAGTETRLINECDISGRTISEKTFGIQVIRASTSSTIGKKFEDVGVPLTSSNVYLFSNTTIQGKKFTTLAQAFNFPYKVADIVSIWPSNERYCFVGSPTDIRKRTEDLNIQGVNFSDTLDRCPLNTKKVCFSQSN